jgi:hypothetical protein
MNCARVLVMSAFEDVMPLLPSGEGQSLWCMIKIGRTSPQIGSAFTRDIASRSGFATVRMDKPGVGDSGGPKCGDADFSEELSAYRSAFAVLKQIEFIDASRIYIIGESNGGGFAPLVPGDTTVRGYLVFSRLVQDLAGAHARTRGPTDETERALRIGHQFAHEALCKVL